MYSVNLMETIDKNVKSGVAYVNIDNDGANILSNNENFEKIFYLSNSVQVEILEKI